MKKAYLFLALALMPFMAGAQARYFSSAKIDDAAPSAALAVASAFAQADSVTPRSLDELHAYLDTMDMSAYDILTTRKPLDKVNFLPSVYTGYEAADTTGVFTPDYGPEPYTHWLDEAFAEARTMNRLKRYLYFNHPDKVCYNINLLLLAVLAQNHQHRSTVIEAPVLQRSLNKRGLSRIKEAGEDKYRNLSFFHNLLLRTAWRSSLRRASSRSHRAFR